MDLDTSIFKHKKIALICTCKKEPYHTKFINRLRLWNFIESCGFIVVRVYSDPTISSSYIQKDGTVGYILTVPFLEHYEFLSKKMELAYTFFSTFDIQGILKVDDDIEIHNTTLFQDTLLPKLSQYDYFGIEDSVFGVKTPSGAWNIYKSKNNNLNMLKSCMIRVNQPVRYMAGPFYWVSNQAIQQICSHGMQTLYEDVSVGLAISKKNTLTIGISKEFYPNIVSWEP